ncbi:MAG: hypothetical protein HYY99_01705 [Candidatus Colwellbacteria bacterium]|nr:hypothetical protein [Candidatus Colwellbacteria bacterium]
MAKYLRSADLTHDIASAVFRVAALVQHERLRKELEGVAVELVKTPETEIAYSLERLVRLAEVAGEISEINAAVLCRELQNLRKLLNSEISESISGVLDSVSLKEVFAEKMKEKEEILKEETRKQGKRQEAILEYLRKFPDGCRMRQISMEFAHFSERTIRTDMQRLINRGLVKRAGSKTGAFGYFQAVDSTSSPQVDSGSLDLQPNEVNLPTGPSVTKEELLPF